MGTLGFSVAELITWAFGEECHTTAEDQSKEEGDAESDAPLSSAIHGVSTQVDAVRQENTEGHEQLVATDHGTTDMTGGTFTLVHGHEQRAATDTETSDPTANDHLVPVTIGRGNLNNQTDVEDNAPESNGPFSAQHISDGGCNQRTDHGTDGQQADNETGAHGAECVRTFCVQFTIPLQVVAHFLEAGNLTRVISKQQTTHRDKESHHQGAHGYPRDRCIDALGVHGLLNRAVLKGRFNTRLLSRGDRLPMVGRRFDTHGVGWGKRDVFRAVLMVDT